MIDDAFRSPRGPGARDGARIVVARDRRGGRPPFSSCEKDRDADVYADRAATIATVRAHLPDPDETVEHALRIVLAIERRFSFLFSDGGERIFELGTSPARRRD